MTSKAARTWELYGPAKVGGDTLSYCGKCKRELAHVIVSMVGTRPAKVICKTCRGQHNFKAEPKTDGTRTSGRPAKPERTTVRASEYWEQRVAESKAKDTKPYSVTGLFTKGDLIQHTLFGVGVVEEVRINGKIEVTFRVGDKILVHGMKSA